MEITSLQLNIMISRDTPKVQKNGDPGGDTEFHFDNDTDSSPCSRTRSTQLEFLLKS